MDNQEVAGEEAGISAAMIRDGRARELKHEAEWIRQKLDLPSDASLGDVQGQMHVMHSNAYGFTTYIESHRCDDKQGEIARLAARIATIRQKLETIVCTKGCDRGVVMLSYDPIHKCQVYDHENFSPLGDALIELYELTGGWPTQETREDLER